MARAVGVPRQLDHEPVHGESSADGGTSHFETDAVRLGHLRDAIAQFCFESKPNSMDDDVLEGVVRSLELAQARSRRPDGRAP